MQLILNRKKRNHEYFTFDFIVNNGIYKLSSQWLQINHIDSLYDILTLFVQLNLIITYKQQVGHIGHSYLIIVQLICLFVILDFCIISIFKLNTSFNSLIISHPPFGHIYIK